MDTLEIIKTTELLGKKLTVYGTADNPLFLAKDVAEWIEYDTSSINKMLANVDDAEKARNTVPTLGGNQEAWFLTEDGLYEVLMQSRKPIAKQFKQGVKEILRDIRKHGFYATSAAIEDFLTNPDSAIQILTAYRDAKAAQAKAEHENARLAENNAALAQQNNQLTQAITANAPKVLFADTVAESSTSILVGELAKLVAKKGVEIGQNRLFEWLRQNGYIMKKNGNKNYPTQRSIDLGILEVKARTITKADGSAMSVFTTKVTGKGQVYFTEKIVKSFKKAA